VRCDVKREQPTALVTLPVVAEKTRKTYTVSWWFETEFGNEASRKCKHTKTFMTKRGAYRHMAVGYVIGRREALGCTRNQCNRTYIVGFDGDGPIEYPCKYCDTRSFSRIVGRLARWLMWRDRKRGVL
jgi:hypothetical protein